MGMFIHGDRDKPLGGSGGSWWTSCAKDSRFNMSGYAGSVFSASMGADRAIREKQKELGLTDEQMDALTIEYGFCKD